MFGKGGAKKRDRWLKGVPQEALALGHEVWSAAGDAWNLSFIDRERFTEAKFEAHGVVAEGAGGLRAGVALTPVSALEALLARLRGDLAQTDRWAPPTDDNRQASWFGSLDELEAQGWQVSCDTEKFGVLTLPVTGCVVRGPEARLFAAVAGERQYDAARQAVADLIAGALEPAEHWAPA